MPTLTERTVVKGDTYQAGTDPGSTIAGYIPNPDAWDNNQPYGGYPRAVPKTGPVEILDRWDAATVNGVEINDTTIDLGFTPTDATILQFQFGDAAGGRLWPAAQFVMSEAAVNSSLFVWNHDNGFLTVALNGDTTVTIVDTIRNAALHSVIAWG